MPKTLRTAEKILFVLNFIGDILEEERNPLGLFSSGYKSILSFSSGKRTRNHIQQSLYRLKKSGLVEKKKVGVDFLIRLTSSGRNKLYKSFRNLSFRPRRKWDGRWRLVSFDVGESYRKVRNLIRSILTREFGFARFQHSLYLSPLKVETELESFLANTKLSGFVRIFDCGPFGDDRELAAKLWRLDEVNDLYRRALKDYEANGNLGLLRWRFLEAASVDPYLPYELLPADWLGDYVEKKAVERLGK